MRWSAGAVGALAALVAACPVSAQLLDPEVAVAVDRGSAEVPWNGTTALTWTVSNAGMVDGEVALVLDVEEAGWWSTDWDSKYQGTFDLSPGESRTFLVEVTPVDPGPQARDASSVRMEATITDAAGRSDSASAGTELGYIAQPVAPPPPPPDHMVRNTFAGATAVLVLLGAAAYLGTGLSFRMHGPDDRVLVRPGLSGYARFRVRNLAPWSQTFQIRLVPADGPWRLATDTGRVQVGPRGTGHATVFVQSTESAAPDMVGEIRLQGRASRFHPWLRSAKGRVMVEHVDLTVWSANAIEAAWRENRAAANGSNGGGIAKVDVAGIGRDVERKRVRAAKK